MRLSGSPDRLITPFVLTRSAAQLMSKAGFLTHRSSRTGDLPIPEGTVVFSAGRSLLTVAGPRGNFTRFPFHSPSMASTLNLFMNITSHVLTSMSRQSRGDRQSRPSGASPTLAQVRHGTVENSAKWLKTSSRYRRVYTTFAVKFETVGKADAELVKETLLLGRGFGDAAQADLVTVRGG